MTKAKTRSETPEGPKSAIEEVVDEMSGPLYKYLFEENKEDYSDKLEEEL